MQLDWTIPIGTVILLGVQFIVGIIAIVRGFAAIEKSIDTRFNAMTLKLNTFQEGDLRELKTSVQRLEQGADEWTKALRERTHELATDVNVLKLKVDRLERPERWHRRHDDPEKDSTVG